MTESIDQKLERLMAGFDNLAQAEQTLRSRGSLLYGDEYEVIKAPIHKMRLDLEAALRTALSAAADSAAVPCEPVGHLYTIAGVQHCTIQKVLPDGPLYTTPQAPTAQPKEGV